jgi:RNA polymerase sigma factor (sigma-70 family)
MANDGMEAIKLDQNPRSLDDAAIVRRIIAGEKELFELLLRRHNQTLYRVVRSYLRDIEEVQDVMQNAYLKAFDKLSQFRGDASFSTWLIRIGINEALLRLNAVKKGKTIYLDPFQEVNNNVIQIPDKQMNPEKAFIRQEAKQLLERAIDNLPEKYRVVYVLKEIEGIESTQVEEMLGLTEANVKVRLHRAKKILKESLYQLSINREVFEFGNAHCDSVVNFVMSRI